jgi:DNA-binding NarL/FixJ family response regulator
MQRILVIEYEDELREIIVGILKDKGFIVAEASHGRVGLQVAQKFYPDLVLCDVDIPDVSGYIVLQELRLDPEIGSIPFIFLTDFLSIDEWRKGMKLGADDYLAKPPQARELVAAIAFQLSRYAQYAQHHTDIHHVSKNEKNSYKKRLSEKLRLTPRQHRILQLFNQGKSIKEIADERSISLDVAKVLEDISVRLNHRLNLNEQSNDQLVPQLQQPLSQENPNSDDKRLTPRQREILKLVANGMTTKEIANSLYISVKTVETHRGQLMDRLNIRDLAGLIRYAFRTGLIDLYED